MEPSFFNAYCSSMYLLNRSSALSRLVIIPTVDNIFCIFSFLTFSFCKSLRDCEVNAKTLATTKTITAANKKVYKFESLFIS